MRAFPRKRHRLILLASGLGVALALAVGTAPANAAPEGAQAARAGESAVAVRLPTNPQAYATATFRAWLRGNETQLSRLAAPPVAQFLLARAPESTRGWSGPECEGAAGSTYCTWTRSETQIVIRVANEAASQGQTHAVTEAFFQPVGDDVAIWPFTTAEEANNTQDQVDQGHSPWLLDPAAVSSFYASAVLGWTDADVQQAQPDPVTFWVTDLAAELVLAQPVRQGEGGIWAVTQAGSIGLG
jgi:hypothetical protein